MEDGDLRCGAGRNNPATGICQACHSPTGGFPGEVKYWRNNQTEETNSDGTDENTPVALRHNSDGVCTDCHQHKMEFAASCTDCHGNSTSGARWPDSLANNPTRSPYADDAGAHDTHLTAILTQNPSLPGTTSTDKKNNACGWCHPGNPPPGHPGDTGTGADRAEVTRMDLNRDNTPEYWTHTNGTTGTLVYDKTINGTHDTDACILGDTNNLVGLFSDRGIYIDSYSRTSTVELYNVVSGYTTNKTLPFLYVNAFASMTGFRPDVTIQALTTGAQPSSITTTYGVLIYGGNINIASTINHKIKISR